ncbi:DMT family transporter [Paenibacillus sp. WQ 127069]|uniref:DMT family transporter n=1 Tax=Paenibacillus baimaensis TaxID=2982185 RepID=A0ABT2UK31_9BACL|nr:DMT family transporter [Paenibacillus sp. WQ 127069]MCU6794481.1 DMT family transporter [Paenibacillus sp. WQ 127069]
MRNKRITYVLLTLSAVFWGANFNAGQIAIQVMSPIQVAAWRFLIAGVCMFTIYLIKERPSWSTVKADLLIHVLMGVSGIFVMNILLFEGLQDTNALYTSLISSTSPFLTLLLSVLVLRERLIPRQMAGFVVSLIGVWLVLTNGSLLELESVSYGALYVLLAAFLWAIYGILGRKYIRSSSPLATTATTMLVGSICYLPFIAFQVNTVGSVSPVSAWMSVLFMSLFCTVLAYLWWNEGIAAIGVNRTSMFFNIVPISTLTISAFSGDKIQLFQIVGVLSVVTGIVLTIGTQETRTNSTT